MILGSNVSANLEELRIGASRARMVGFLFEFCMILVCLSLIENYLMMYVNRIYCFIMLF